MEVQLVILAVSVLNLILLLVNLCLLRRGYTQARQQLQIVVLQQPGPESPPGGVVSAHRVVIVGKRGTMTYFNGERDAVTDLRLHELRGCEGDVADLYVVPRPHVSTL